MMNGELSHETNNPDPQAIAPDLASAMVSRGCPVCGSQTTGRVLEARFDSKKLDSFAFASRKLPEYMHYRLVECPDCDLLYANPIPQLEELNSGYRDAAFDSAEEARFAARTYAGQLARFMNRLPDRVGALDIGTGDGAFLSELIASGFSDVVGVEPSSAPIAASSPEIRPLIRHGMFRSADFQEGTYSLVTCFQTIEHVDNPLEIGRGTMSLLKPGGALFLICHNRKALANRLMGRKSPIFDIEHLQLFSPESGRRLLQECGFVNVQARSMVNRYPLQYWMKLFPMPSGLKKRVMDLAYRTGIGRLPVTLPVGNLTVVGFKPREENS